MEINRDKKRRKSTRNQVEERIYIISKLLIKGYSREEILQYSAEKWGIKERQADEYLSGARSAIFNSPKRNITYDYNLAIKRYEALYKVTLAKKDYRTAFAINKELTNLQRLTDIKVEIGYKDTWRSKYENMTNEELDAKLKEYQELAKNPPIIKYKKT